MKYKLMTELGETEV
jgi:hypothetical protein